MLSGGRWGFRAEIESTGGRTLLRWTMVEVREEEEESVDSVLVGDLNKRSRVSQSVRKRRENRGFSGPSNGIDCFTQVGSYLAVACRLGERISAARGSFPRDPERPAERIDL